MNGFQYSVETLENRLRLVSMPLPHLHSAFLGAFASGGCAYEQADNAGASHLLEHLHLSVTDAIPSRLDFSRAIDSCGGEFNALTTRDAIAFYFSVRPESLDLAAALLSDALVVRRYPEEIVESEKALIASEIFSDTIHQDAEQWCLSLLYGPQSVGLPSIGTLGSVQTMEHDVLYAFDRKAFSSDNLTVVLVGNFEQEQLVLARDKFAALTPTGESLSMPKPDGSAELPYYLSRCVRYGYGEMIATFTMPKSSEPKDSILMRFLPALLNSPSSSLYEKVRYREGNAYYYEAAAYDLAGRHFVNISAPMATDKVYAFMEAVFQELGRLAAGELDPACLQNAIKSYVHFMESAVDNPSALGFRIGIEQTVSRDDAVSLEREYDIITHVAAADVAEVAHKIFRPENLLLMFGANKFFFRNAKARKIVAATLGNGR